MFCVECGTEGTTTDGLCATCFAERHRVLDPLPHLDVSRCAQCESWRLGSGWVRTDLGDAVRVLLSERIKSRDPFESVAFTFRTRAEDPNNFALEVRALGVYGALRQSEDFRTRLRVKPSRCDTCAKERSHYYVGILQVRGTGRELTPSEIRDIRTFVMVRVDRARDTGEFVSKIDTTEGGLDFYVSTNAFTKVLAREVAHSFGGTVSSSPKLFGKRGGKEIFRVTSLVRLAPFRIGGVVRYKGTIHEVVSLAPLMTLRDLVTGERRRFKPKDLRGARAVRAERFEADLGHEGTHLLATHPETGVAREVTTRGVRPGRGVVVWTEGDAFVSSLPIDPSKG